MKKTKNKIFRMPFDVSKLLKNDFFKSSAMAMTVSLVMSTLFETISSFLITIMNGKITLAEIIKESVSKKQSFYNFFGTLFASFCFTLLVWGVNCIIESLETEERQKRAKMFSFIVIVLYFITMFFYAYEKASHTITRNFTKEDLIAFSVFNVLLYFCLAMYFVRNSKNQGQNRSTHNKESDDAKVAS